MRLSARFGAAMSFIAIAFAAACGSDSTGPSASDQPSRVAQHFDSIYTEAQALSDAGHDAFALRAELATLIEVNAAFGAAPAPITVTTHNGTEHWKGYELLELGSSSDSTYVLLAYREADAHTVAVVYFRGDGTIQQAALVTNDTLVVEPNDGSGATSVTQTGATCGAISSALTNPLLTSVSIASCNIAKFGTSLSLQMPSTTGMDAALTSLSFPVTTVNGILVVDSESSRRIRYLLHMNHGANKL
jgi:hypothetical protein